MGVSGLLLGPEGVNFTTSQVTPAASAIVATMNTAMPMRPRTFSTDLE